MKLHKETNSIYQTEKMNIVAPPRKLTNSFYQTEHSDTRLRFSINVPDDVYNEEKEAKFNPNGNDDFLRRLRELLDT